MTSKSRHIKELYEKYRTSSANDTEIKAFFDYLQNPENLEVLKQEMTLDWEEFPGRKGESPLSWKDIELEISKLKANERKLGQTRMQKRYWWAAAASILVVIGLSLGIYVMSGPNDYLIYSTGYGEVEKILLDDGSQVTLNANSVLKWKSNWLKDGKRVAILNGEAFFDVNTVQDKNTGEKTGFDVQTEDLRIQVAGTEFNVKSRTEKTDIFLKEGKILLNLKDIGTEKPQKKEELIVMQPGESVSYSARTQNLKKAESDQYGNASWMAGTFMYSNKSVREILLSLEEIYGIKFEVEDQRILEQKLTTNLPYSDWTIVESSLELLLQSQLQSKEEDQTIIIKKE